MGGVQIAATVLAAVVTVFSVAIFVRAIRGIVRVVKLGQPDPTRGNDKGTRTATMLRETLGHTKMLKWSVVGASHWFVMVAFGALFFTLVEAYGETVDPTFELPVIGHWAVYGLLTEFIAVFGTIGIAILIVIRLRNLPTRTGGRSRFTG